jgi:hypothetical protein
VRTRVKVGIPVHVHHVGTGDKIMVDRVILDEDQGARELNSFLSIRAFWFCPVGGTAKACLAYVQ